MNGRVDLRELSSIGKAAFLQVEHRSSTSNRLFEGLPIRAAIATISPDSILDGSSSCILGLSKRTTDEGLRECFAKFGEVVHVVKDRASGWSKGFGLVRYTTLEGVAVSIEGMDGKEVGRWNLEKGPEKAQEDGI
ncbi:hypothetical protein L6452_18099 [Arctium lappa]|uniref:Uncharacterized protein n=1 Tax=Arctium lappa TaxID=4217 RepID=A0ACB9C579_ARCLA|nr:hypothetical protein L6452_18099 [Arctium lappa]